MARTPCKNNSTRDPNDNGSKFYICVADSSGLDQTYTVFGEVFRGMEVLDKIAASVRDDRDNPLESIPNNSDPSRPVKTTVRLGRSNPSQQAAQKGHPTRPQASHNRKGVTILTSPPQATG
jgi:cyclophilin family peptidyl-prolyl cis-trans isomerase